MSSRDWTLAVYAVAIGVVIGYVVKMRERACSCDQGYGP